MDHSSLSSLYTNSNGVGNGNGLLKSTHPSLISGRFLAHCRYDPVGRAFIAADLHSGAFQLTKPTMVQAAQLARISIGYAWWAEKRQTERAAIEAGLLPLVPRHRATPVTVLESVEINNMALVDFVRRVGLERVLDAAVVVEAAQ